MIDYQTLYKMTYGIYVVCSGNSQKGNGFICNSVMQVTSEPPQLAVTCHKNNYSAELIAQSGVLSVSILPQEVSQDIISTFGYQSGRNTDKLKQFNIRYGINDVPVMMNEVIGTLECQVKETIDVGSHWLYIVEIMQADLYKETADPITYALYRKERKAASPKNAPTYIDESKLQKAASTEKYRCQVCGYVYDESEHDAAFNALNEDWVCPICGAGRELFEKI
jgi:flavin reductase (DIM6/NTAB) family NADH-FMN oxidoreductase RutF